MTDGSPFLRFSVLLGGLWASQCPQCGHVIVIGQDEEELTLAEAAHQCPAKKPNASINPDRHREESSRK